MIKGNYPIAFALSIMILVGSVSTMFARAMPPIAKEISAYHKVNGITLETPYSWLENRENPQVIKHLNKENAYAKAMLSPSAKLAKSLYKDFKSHIVETVTSHPYLEHGYYYYTRTEAGKAYTIHCRKKGSLKAAEEIILDENTLAQGKEYFAIGLLEISPNQKRLAYSVDYKGDEVYQLFIKDLSNSKTAPTPVSSISELKWMADNLTVVYTTQNLRMQTDMCWRWSFGSQQTQCIYQEDDPGWDVSLYVNCDNSMIFVSTSSKDASEVYFLQDDDYEGRLRCLQKRKAKLQYSPDYYDGKFYILTNKWNLDYDLVVSEYSSEKTGDWTVLWGGKLEQPISSFSIFSTNVVLKVRQQGFESFVIIDRLSGVQVDAMIPDEPMDLSFWVNTDPLALDFTYTSENDITPLTIFSYNFYDQRSTVLRQYPPAGVYNPQDYTTMLLWAVSADSVEIPIRLTMKRGVAAIPGNPLILNGYGAYGDNEDPYFSSSRISMLDKGIIFATAHIRGGGELGQSWYDDGRLQNKKNSFTDFIACMDYLVQNGWTSYPKLVIEGGSAGGLLIGAVVNMAPQKCMLAIADVPFVDLINTMLDDNLPLTVQEYEEWGNPNQAAAFDYMLSYSPVDNVHETTYPSMLISAAWNDTRVSYWEAAKWTAVLRKNNTGTNPIIFRLNWNEGHTGQVDRYSSLRSYAETMGYVLYRWGF